MTHRYTAERRTKYTIFLVLAGAVLFARQTWCATFKNGAQGNEDSESTPLENYIDESSIIKTMGCVIPHVDSQDNSIKKLFQSKEPMKVCKHHYQRLLESNQTHIWIVKRNFNNYDIYNESNFVCCYRSFHPIKSAQNQSPDFDNRVQYRDCFNFKNVVKANNEFVKVICFYEDPDEPIYEQFFVFAPKKRFTAFRVNPFMTPANQRMYNVIIMGIGSMSRQNFYRSMTETVQLLKNYNAIELKGYSRVASSTFQNVMPMLVGSSTCWIDKQSSLNSCPFIWERFKDMGYYTALMEDTSRFSMFNRETTGFSGNPTDYYVHPFLDQAELAPRHYDRRTNEAPVITCMGDKYYFQVLLKYVQDITSTLKRFKIFGVFWETSMTRDSLKGSVTMDFEYYKLVKNMEATGNLKDTIMIFMSDHGIDIPKMRSKRQGRIEQRLPLFFILVPPSFQEQYNLAYLNLKLNEGRLTTPFDVHKTLLDLIHMTEITDDKIIKRSNEFYTREEGISLFLEIPRNRTCKMAGIPNAWCACNDEMPVASSNPILIDAMKFITNKLNEILMPHPECLKLIVEEIVIAKEMVPRYENTTEWRDFKLIVSVEPGSGIFEIMLRYHNKKWTIIDNLKRLNCLGFHSLCVEDPVIKLLCYCKSDK